MTNFFTEKFTPETIKNQELKAKSFCLELCFDAASCDEKDIWNKQLKIYITGRASEENSLHYLLTHKTVSKLHKIAYDLPESIFHDLHKNGDSILIATITKGKIEKCL